MTAKNLFLLGSMVFLLSACGGSEETTQQELTPSPIGKDLSTPLAQTLNLSGVVGETTTAKTQVSGAVSSNRGIVGSATANAQATITLSQPNEVIQGNIAFLLSVSDPDGINAVNLVLPTVNKSLAMCTEECGTTFEQSIIGLSPYFHGVTTSDLRLEIWITDNLNNQVLADAITVNWQPYQIEGVTAQRNEQSIVLSWQENENLNRYNVYLATEAGITTTNINDFENGQQVLGLSGSTYTISDSLADKSYQVLITGIDGSGESGFAEIINIAPVGGELNFAPKAVNDLFEINEDQTLQNNVLTNDSDQFKGVLNTNTSPLVSPQHGSVTISQNGEFTYTPRINFNGVDAFSYQVINELGMTDTGTVNITINAVNDTPIALDNTYSVNAEGTLLVTAPGLLANDSDIDLDSLIVDTTPVSPPIKGNLTLNSDGSFEYIRSANMQGTDSFTYRIIDTQGAQAIASVTINDLDQNSPPLATNDSYSVNEDSTLVVGASQGLLANDTDPNNDTFIIDDTYLISPTHGQLLLATDGSFTYIPDPHFYGVDEFQYQVIDALGATATATATLTINSMPDNPIAQNDEYQFQYSQTLSIAAENGLLKNDVNIESGGLTVNTTPVVNVQSGSLTLSNDGSFTYEPNLNALEVDSFTYSVTNEQGLAATAQVILTKTGSNSPAQANDDQYTLSEDSPSTMLNVLDNDTDANGDTITLTSIANTIGTARIVNNSIEYTPEPNYFGEVTLNYTISDGITPDAPSSNATVTLTIVPINDSPVANPDNTTISEDATAISINVLTNDTDVDNDTLSISSANASSGSVYVAGGNLVYTTQANFNGQVTVNYTLTDGTESDVGVLTITVTAVNDVPVANPDTATILEDADPLLVDVLANDTDIENDTLTIIATETDLGIAEVIGNKIKYTSTENSNGTATVNYIINDGNGGTANANLIVEITPVNDAPVSLNQSFSISENATDDESVGTIVATDIENQALNYTLISGDTALFNINSNSGLLRVKGDNAFDYDTNPKHNLVIGITEATSPNETTSINVVVNILEEAESLVPVEDDSFGRAITGNLELSTVFSSGEFNDSVTLKNNIYFVGFTNNTDKDIIIASYTSNGEVNNNFNNGDLKTFDFNNDEVATAIIADNNDLFIAFSSFDGDYTEACLLKINLNGQIDDDSGTNDSGVRCTSENSTLVINDLEIKKEDDDDDDDDDDNKSEIFAVGKRFDGTQNDSLWIKYKASNLDFKSSTPKIEDVSGASRDDEGLAVKNFEKSEFLVVGSVTSADGDKDSLIRYLKSDGKYDDDFNDGDPLIIDLSGNNSDDELFAVDGKEEKKFTAFAGGYITRASGEKEAVVFAVDEKGKAEKDIAESGVAVYDIDGDNYASNGGAVITGVAYEPINKQIMLTGTTGKETLQDLFSARISIDDGELDNAYGSSGINKVSSIGDKQVANAISVDANDTLWVSGANDGSSSEPFIAAIDDGASLFTNFENDGYRTFSNTSIDSDDQSTIVIQLKNGGHAGKYVMLSTAESDSVFKLVLTRFTTSGFIDTSFSDSGHRQVDIELSSSSVDLIEQSDGKLIIVGSQDKQSNTIGFVAKVTQNGHLDTSFATDGIYSTEDIAADKLSLVNVAINNNGDIIAVGSLDNADVPSSLVIMLNQNGTLQSSFGNGGAKIGDNYTRYETVSVDSSNNIYVGGKYISGLVSEQLAVKLTSTGSEVFTFTDTDASFDSKDRVVKILADEENNLYLIGNDFNTLNVTVIKLQPNGAKDTSFATNGVGQYSLTSSSNSKVTDAALDSAGKLILSGIANAQGVLARVLINGELDDKFGSAGVGYYEAEQCSGVHTFTSLILQNDTQVVVSNTCGEGSTNNVSISKYNFYVDGVEP